MKSTLTKFFALLAISLPLALTACSPSTVQKTLEPRPELPDVSNLVSATGKVIPGKETLLSVSAGGVVEDVLVKKGDSVNAGQVLVRLEGSEQQAAIVSAAELALANARFELEKLYKDTDLMAAEAFRSAESAERALEDLNNSEQQEAQAVRAVAAAEEAVEAAERNLAILTQKPPQSAIDQAYSNMLLAENKLNKTLDDIADVERKLKKYSSYPAAVKQLRQALKGLEIVRTQDQLAYNRAVTKYNDLQRDPDPVDREVAEANYLATQAQLLQAQRELERIQDGPDAGDVAVLQAQIDKGYRDYEIFSAGPDPDDVALAEARVSNAEVQVVAAKEVLTDLELTAPFDGVISDVYINTSEWVAPGSPVLLLADLDHLRVETTDLSEIDVAKIQVGDVATITFDALPGLSIEGTILRIAPKADTSAGVNYPVLLELSEIPPELRWGMTAFVDIGIEQ